MYNKYNKYIMYNLQALVALIRVVLHIQDLEGGLPQALMHAILLCCWHWYDMWFPFNSLDLISGVMQSIPFIKIWQPRADRVWVRSINKNPHVAETSGWAGGDMSWPKSYFVYLWRHVILRSVHWALIFPLHCDCCSVSGCIILAMQIWHNNLK